MCKRWQLHQRSSSCLPYLVGIIVLLLCAQTTATDGTRIISGSWDKLVQVWDAPTGKELNVLNSHTESVNLVTFLTDGTHIVSGFWDKSVRVWDTLKGKELNILNGHTLSVSSVAF